MGLSFRTAGESHGRGLVAILEGLPKGLPIDTAFVDRQLRRRQGGYGRGGRQRIESDHVEVLTGIYRGRSIDAPLALWVENRDDKIEELPEPTRPRPGHVDLVGCQRHGDRDIRACLERASARETAARVAAGAVAQLLLRELGLAVLGHVVELGGVCTGQERGAGLESLSDLERARERVEASPFGVLPEGWDGRLRDAVDRVAKQGDSLGGVVEVVAVGMPPGLGSYAQWNERLDGRLAQALISIQAFKGVEIGLGFDSARQPGSEVHDEIIRSDDGSVRRRSNRAGGIEGGLSTGEPIVLRAAKKPIATVRRRLASIDLKDGSPAEAGFERSDVTAVPAAAVIAEAMVALILADAVLTFFAGAHVDLLRAACEAHRERAAKLWEQG
ncbi:MAG: chorismate synthase [Planctomycetota bacterium]|nr:MAG: chorismate synthase [Planctomycetota bacterium]